MQAISILIVEDDVLTLEFLSSSLCVRFPGVAVHKASDGMEGLDLFLKHSPQLVITDLNMPGMNGIQLATRIRSIKPDTRFIALTGYLKGATEEESGENGFRFDHYIVKPIIFKDLFPVIERCLNQNG